MGVYRESCSRGEEVLHSHLIAVQLYSPGDWASEMHPQDAYITQYTLSEAQKTIGILYILQV